MSEKYDFLELNFAVRKWVVMSQFENDLQRYENLIENHWIVDVKDADDGSGDAILTFPDELTMLCGWQEGTELNIEQIDGTIVVSKVEKSK